MSKTPARKAPPKKTTSAKGKVVASKPAKNTKPVAAKKHAAPPTKSVKAAAHPVKSAKPAVAAKPSKPSKPATTPAKATPPAAAAKPKLPMKSAPSPAPVPAVATATAAAAPTGGMAPLIPRKAGRGASKYAAPAVQAPLPPPTSRFADRFAPPRPPTRQMNNLELDTPREKQKFDPKLANAWKSKAGRELTEPEVLAMPESEYMNDKQLEFFRTKLQQLKDDLLSNAGETTEHLREDTSIVPDPADRATIEEEHALELRTRDRERKLLKKISQSLGRIESGEYGFCDETGEPIGLGRLIARPTATLSLEAQQRRELKQKMFGD
ncbi:MAG: RNA polymerase-binding protein DksA [Burkholderiales bacterium]